MQIRSLSGWMTICFTALMVAALSPNGHSKENIDRGFIAVPQKAGSLYLGWRFLQSDAPDAVFEVQLDENPKFVEARHSTNLVLDNPPTSGTHTYHLYMRTSDGDRHKCGSITVKPFLKPFDCFHIPFKGDYTAQKVGVGDLDGDGQYEYVIKQPNFNTDPYQQPGYWKRSTTTYKLEAYELDGTLMWRYDMGWAIEAGIWYSPWLVYDVDQDGKAEVYAKAGEGDPREPEGHVESGPEYLVKINGETGKIVAKTDWPSREGFDKYNYYCRNFLAVAYLDGRNPSLIIQRGTYRLIKIQALDRHLNQIWYWEATGENKDYRGQSAHNLVPSDVDRDGKDEIVIGAAVIDDNGKGLWTLKMGHPDMCYVADIDPDNEGLEIFYGFETRQQTHGICVVDAKTGKILWGHDKPTRHIHSQGMAADVLAEYPGIEVYGGERDYEERWFYSAKGDLIDFLKKGPLSIRAVWWDADPQKEVVMNGAIRDWGGEAQQTISGRAIGIADCLGDYREELLTSRDGELRIYTTTVPAENRRPCLMQDRQYRLGVAVQTMGYWCPAQLGEY